MKQQWKTGDVVLFNGQWKTSRFVRAWTRSTWSHIGMVVVDDNDEPLMIESLHISLAPDVVMGTEHRGVQLVKLHERIAAETHPVGRGRLHATEATRRLLRRRALSLHGRPYGMRVGIGDWVEILEMLCSTGPRAPRPSSCGEVIAHTYQGAGLLGDGTSACHYTPADFARARSLLEGELEAPRLVFNS